nr:ulp1 protease family, C-terminal catalytic domain-containing protein [Tanacetum cinerariifolium]
MFADVNKSNAKYTKDNSNDEDNEDNHSVEEEQNTEDYESVKTLPVKKRGRPKKTVRANDSKSSSIKRRMSPRNRNDELKKKTIGSKRKGREYKVDDDDENNGTKKMKKKSKIYDENNKNRKIRTRTTPTALFNAMAILNGDRKKCLDEMGFGSMIGMGIHELPGKLGFYVIDNLDTETNVLSLTYNSILVTSQSAHDILGTIGGCSLESLAPRSPDDPFIKEWLSQFGDKNEVRRNDITDVIVSTKDARKLFKMNFLMLFANTMGLCEKSGVCNMNILKKIIDDVCVEKIDWCSYIITCLKESKQKWVNPDKNHYTGPVTFMIDFIKMIQNKCYNVHQDLRSIRETLNEGLSRFPDCKKLNKLVKKFEEDFKKKDLVRNDENDDTTATTNDKNDLLQFDSKMESDSPVSNDDDGKQDVVMDEIDEQNKEDLCKQARSIYENKCVEIQLTYKRHAWQKKSVMDNENKDAEAVELSSSIKICGHPMKHSYNLDVKDVNEPITEKINNENKYFQETPFEFADRKDEQTVHKADTSKKVNEKCTAEESTNIKNNDDYELSKNADAKSEKENEEFDALAITICNVCHPVPLRVLMPNENLNDFPEIINIEDSESEKEEFDFGGDTDNEEKEIVFETYEGFKVLAIEMETLATGLDVHYEVINTWCDVLNTIEKDKKDDGKTMRKYCFKTGFLQANFLDKSVDAIMKVKNFEKKLKEAVNNDTALMKL